MRILSWNIQYTKGCDGRFDFNRIANVIQSFGDLDLICLQEVSRNIELYNNDDQKQGFEALFPSFDSVWAPGFSQAPNSNNQPHSKLGSWQEFGNLSLVKPGLLLNRRSHILPSPAIGNTPQTSRSLAEIVVRDNKRSLAIFNCHLAYHSAMESSLQLEYITHLRDQNLSHCKPNMTKAAPSMVGVFEPQDYGDEILLCGDLNIDLNSSSYLQLTDKAGWVDCATRFLMAHSKLERRPTCGVSDLLSWPQGPHTRDFFLSTEALSQRVRRYDVDTLTQASDHQPILLELDEPIETKS